jgi:hypothetical protein
MLIMITHGASHKFRSTSMANGLSAAMWKAKSRSPRRFNILLTDKTIDEKQKYDGQNSTQHGMKTHEMHSVNDGETHTQHEKKQII